MKMGGSSSFLPNRPIGGVAVDSNGNVYVGDSGDPDDLVGGGMIKKFTSNGNFIKEWSGPLVGGQTWGIFIDDSDKLWVCAVGPSQNREILKFDLNGNLLTRLCSISHSDLFDFNSVDIRGF
jgi:DNA-binding beta-propeller fold protein YncE